MAMTLAHSQPYPAPHKAGHYNISAAKAKQLVSDFKKAKKSMVILDIRTPEEHAGSHIQDSLLIDYLGDDFKASLSKLDKEKVYLIHCRSGGRSSSAFDLMKKLGFKVRKDGVGEPNQEIGKCSLLIGLLDILKMEQH